MLRAMMPLLRRAPRAGAGMLGATLVASLAVLGAAAAEEPRRAGTSTTEPT